MAANPLPRNTSRSRYESLQACWHVSVMLHDDGSYTATVGKLELVSKHMRFAQLASGTWSGPADLAAARALVDAAREAWVDTSEQLTLF